MGIIETLAIALASIGIGGAVVTSGAVAGTVIATTLSYMAAYAIVGAVIYGGVALSASLSSKNVDFGATSPTYSSGVLQTQTNQDLPIPIVYGTCKLAGNRIWQNDSNETTIKRIVAFSEGEISGFEDVKLNDIRYVDIKGISSSHYFGTSNQNIDPIVGGNSQEERAEKVGSLRNVAYLAIEVPKSEKIDINYNLTVLVHGKKVRVYSTPTKYEVKYSENPAWCLFNFLTCYNGLGLGLDNYGISDENLISQLFDIDSFIEAAAFCDELVNGKPRFTFNMIFDSQTSARSLLDEIYRSCRGGLFTKNGKLQFKIDKAGPVCQHISADAIVKGSETFQPLPSEEHYDILKCVYVSPQHEWQKVEAFAEVPEYRDGVPIEHSVNIYSCTNFEQASRLAWYYVNSKVLQPYFGSFQTDYRVYDREVGDVITFDSLLMGLEKYPVKITSIVDDGAGTFTVNWRHYDERLYSDELGSKEPHVLVSSLSDIVVVPPDVENFNVVQSSTLLNFVWQSCGDDVSYEIREGESWEYGLLVKKGITENNLSIEIPRRGLLKYWIKAFNGYNTSVSATLDVISIGDIPNTDEFVTLDILGNTQGTFNNTHRVYESGANILNSGWHLKLFTSVKWQTIDKPWQDARQNIYDANGTVIDFVENDNYYNNREYWGADVCNSGTYISQDYDITRFVKCIVKFDIAYTKNNPDSDVLIEWAYSGNGYDWSEWTLTNPGEFAFRYCRFRITLTSADGSQVSLDKFKIIIDVPEVEENILAEITNELEGVIIHYNFVNLPTVIATVNDNINAYAVVVEKTNEFARIKAYTNNGEPTTCSISVRARGF